jgi:hypothetical protein
VERRGDMPFFKISIDGFESAYEDLEKERDKIGDASGSGLHMVESEMYESLQRHIREDWYEPWGPPKVYLRRTDDPTLGPPLGDLEKNVNSDVNDLILTFNYSPSGEHENEEWDDREGDELIRVIQFNRGWSYPVKEDVHERRIMPRPFWNNFVEEQFNGLAFDSFSYGFSGRGYDLISEGVGKDLEFTGGESLVNPD